MIILTGRLMRPLLFILLIDAASLSAQDVTYARQVVNALCDSNMKGRGYVDKGDHTAAEFICSAFKKAGLNKYSKTYLQDFTIPVNTFPRKMEVKINDQILQPGQDYLVDPGSPGISGTFSIVMLHAEDILQDSLLAAKINAASGKFIVVDIYSANDFTKDENKRIHDVITSLQHASAYSAAGFIVLTNDKLTWSGSTTRNIKPSLIIKASSIKESIANIFVNIESAFIKNYKTQNVVGYLEGDRNDSMLVYTAHYDHLGMMGDQTMFPGANDNASGVAFMLSLMQYYSRHKPNYTTVFIAFAGEELGLLGAKYFTDHPLFPLSKIKFLINFDMAGTGDEGIQVVNGKIYKQKFELLTQINNQLHLVTQVKSRGEACNSDHCMFYKNGVPCFFIYTLGGIQAYHDIDDKPQTLPLTDFEDYFKLIIEFVKQI